MRKRTWNLRRLIILPLLLMAAVMVPVLPARAAGAEVAVEVLQVGWDGTVVPFTWSPVRVRLTGGSADLDARVEVIPRVRYQPGPQATAIEYPIGAYGQEVALPAGVTKEVTLWLPGDGSIGGGITAGSVRLTAGGQLLAEQQVEFKATKTPFWPLIGVLAESSSVARAVTQVELAFQGLPIPLSAARLSAADLPASGERLGALKALVVQGNAAANLTGEQRRAVQDWVAAGGHLLLLGGPDAARVAAVLPTGALPVTFTGADGAADLSPLVRWAGPQASPPSTAPVARFESNAGSPLAGEPDNLLAWRMGLGQGTVTLLAADPSLEPLASWSGTPLLLQKALGPALPDTSENEKIQYVQMQQRDIASQLQGALGALPADAYPDWRVGALILGGFALVVGPLLHLLLRRFDRRGWVWLAVPAAALVVATTLYAVGVGREGRDVLVNMVSHVQLDPVGGPARQDLAAGFFSPTHPDLAVTMAGDTPLRVGSQYGGPSFGPGGVPNSPAVDPPFHVLSGRETRVEFASGQWTMRTVSLSRSLGKETGRVVAALGLDGGLIVGTVRNDTPYLLEDAAVAVGQSLVKLGSLAPGQTAQVTLDPSTGPDPYRGGFPLSWRLFGQTPGSGGGGGQVMYAPSRISAVVSSAGPSSMTVMTAPGGVPERLELPQDPEVQRRVRLMDPLLSRPSMGPGGPTVPLTFLAFTTEPVGDDFPTAGNHPTYHLSMVEEPLSLDLPPGPFTMPSSLVISEVLEQTGGYGMGSNGTVTWVDMREGSSVTYGFRLPLPNRARADALLIKTQQLVTSAAPGSPSPSSKVIPPSPGAGTEPAAAGIFSAYNWETAHWDPLPGGEETTRLEPASPYVGPDGQVKVQMTAPPEGDAYAVVPELSVEGTVQE